METAEAPRRVIGVKFGFSDNTYDYFCDFPIGIGDRVWVPTSRGKAKATVFEIKAGSDRAEKAALEPVEE
jgi:primosomal protein N'